MRSLQGNFIVRAGLVATDHGDSNYSNSNVLGAQGAAKRGAGSNVRSHGSLYSRAITHVHPQTCSRYLTTWATSEPGQALMMPFLPPCPTTLVERGKKRASKTARQSFLPGSYWRLRQVSRNELALGGPPGWSQGRPPNPSWVRDTWSSS